jgi:hypothetical protein
MVLLRWTLLPFCGRSAALPMDAWDLDLVSQVYTR